MSERTAGGLSAVNLALLLVGGYVVIRYVLPLLATLSSGFSAASQAVGQAGANAYLRLTAPGVLQPESQTMGIPGALTFPDGSSIPFTSLQNQTGTWSATDSAGNFYFTWQGGSQVYQLAGNSASGYLATPVPYTLAQANRM